MAIRSSVDEIYFVEWNRNNGELLCHMYMDAGDSFWKEGGAYTM